MQNKIIREIENEIIYNYNQSKFDYTEMSYLLRLRKSILNEIALSNQASILQTIIEFNEALRESLYEMFNRAHQIWGEVKQKTYYGSDIELVAECFLDKDYPTLHPIQDDDRDCLWEALSDSGWNPLYDTGVTYSLILSEDCLDESFDTFIGMDCPPPNWNEGLDPELTKDLHLINAFHNLFDHTNFALTDFIYVRKFNTRIRIEINK